MCGWLLLRLLDKFRNFILCFTLKKFLEQICTFLGTQSVGGLFGSKPASSGLFGSSTGTLYTKRYILM